MKDFRSAFAERYGFRWPEIGDVLPARYFPLENPSVLIMEAIADHLDEISLRLERLENKS